MNQDKAIELLAPFKGKNVFTKINKEKEQEGIIYDEKQTMALICEKIRPYIFKGEKIINIKKAGREYYKGVVLVEHDNDNGWLLETDACELTFYKNEEAFIKINSYNDKEMEELLKNKNLKEAKKIIKKELTIPMRIVENNTKKRYKGIPHTLSYGFEIEFSEKRKGRNDVSKINNLHKQFNVNEKTIRNQEIDLGRGKIITITSNHYESRKDVVKIYHDGSVAYELVTRPFLLNEIESKMPKIYEGIKKVLKANYDTEFAGGHITLMEGQHLEKPLNELCVLNFIQLGRCFFPQMHLLSSNLDYWRGTEYACLNEKISAYETIRGHKYNCFNKRTKRTNTGHIITGIEMRAFMSPNSPTVCEENARILEVLWRIAEKISRSNSIIKIKQFVYDHNKEIDLTFKARKKWKKTELLKSSLVKNLNKFFVRLVEEEAKKLGVYEIILKRLKIRNTNKKPKELKEEQYKEIIRLVYNLKLQGYTKEKITTKVLKSFGKMAEWYLKEI